MEKKDWSYEDDEYIKDQITLALLVIKDAPKNPDLSEKGKQSLIDDCLDKLNLLYNEQRKRGTFKRNNG
jgi:hypothetical protein